MLKKWLNYILHLSSYIYKKKDELLTKSIFKCIINSLIIIFLEIFLSIISLPIFLFVPKTKIKLKTKEEEEKIGSTNIYFANFMILLGVVLIIISFYSISIIFPSANYILIFTLLFLFVLYSVYSEKWTDLTFKISNYLFSKKQNLIKTTKKLESVILSLYIVVLELFLVVISLPVYVLIKPEKLKEIKGEKFILRRKMTLIYFGLLLFIFILQIIVAMIIVQNFYPPNVSSLN